MSSLSLSTLPSEAVVRTEGGPRKMLGAGHAHCTPAAEYGGEGQMVCLGPREASAVQHCGSCRRCRLSKAQCFPAEERGACPMGRGLAGPHALPFGLPPQSQLQSWAPRPPSGVRLCIAVLRAYIPFWLFFFF